jgi:hypothetical protein
MAQAADSRIGFHSTAKVPAPVLSTPGDRPLAKLHAWQASPAGMIASHVAALGATTADLERLAARPLGLCLLAPELPDLERIQTEISQLIAKLRRSRGRVA